MSEVKMIDAPKNSLPEWRECALRVRNSEDVKNLNLITDEHSKLANPIHEFIYEYDDSDPYRSTWFMHRLELLIEHVKAEALRVSND